jgi:hypothetical protein
LHFRNVLGHRAVCVRSARRKFAARAVRVPAGCPVAVPGVGRGLGSGRWRVGF